MNDSIFKKRFEVAGLAVIIPLHVFLDKSGELFDDIVVTVNHVVTVFLVEIMEKTKGVGIDVADVRELLVFPELLTVAEVDIGKAAVVIVLNCGIINVLIVSEIVHPASVALMAVTD